jgi:hypothetical protein
LTGLVHVELVGTQVTEAGVRALHSRLPDLHVIR